MHTYANYSNILCGFTGVPPISEVFRYYSLFKPLIMLYFYNKKLIDRLQLLSDLYYRAMLDRERWNLEVHKFDKNMSIYNYTSRYNRDYVVSREERMNAVMKRIAQSYNNTIQLLKSI